MNTDDSKQNQVDSLPDGTKLPPIPDEKWEEFERSLPRKDRDEDDR